MSHLFETKLATIHIFCTQFISENNSVEERIQLGCWWVRNKALIRWYTSWQERKGHATLRRGENISRKCFVLTYLSRRNNILCYHRRNYIISFTKTLTLFEDVLAHGKEYLRCEHWYLTDFFKVNLLNIKNLNLSKVSMQWWGPCLRNLIPDRNREIPTLLSRGILLLNELESSLQQSQENHTSQQTGEVPTILQRITYSSPK